jgi:hypothetical protein
MFIQSSLLLHSWETQGLGWSYDLLCSGQGQGLSPGLSAAPIHSLPKVQIMLSKNKNCIISQLLVAHAYNPSYSGGRHQEGHGSKTAQAK